MAQRDALTWIFIIIVGIVLAWLLWPIIGGIVGWFAQLIGFFITLAIVIVIVYLVVKLIMGGK